MVDYNIIKEERIKKNLTVTDLANLCSVSASYITKIEKGNVKITDSMQNKLAEVLNLKKGLKFEFKANDATFLNNKINSVHRWYPYIEGFSQGFVDEILDKYNSNVVVYDPFNGSGTTSLTCAYRGVKPIASEINPLMRFIANTKVNTVRNIYDGNKLSKLINEVELMNSYQFEEDIDVWQYMNDCYKGMDFFNDYVIKQIANIKKFIKKIDDDDISNLFKLALASITVESSNMIRSVDLRRKKPNELNRIPKDVKKRFCDQLGFIVNDIVNNNVRDIAELKFINDNAKILNSEHYNTVDVIITSPPYVNGTNYFRNTKLELWVLDYISSDKDLGELRTKAITAGINNVSSRIIIENTFDSIENVVSKLDEVSPDKRIPKLIRAYFSDMYKVFGNFNRILKNGGEIYFDIGDSQYYGVHIPVFQFITEIAQMNGFVLDHQEVLRNRKSKNGMTLSQELLIFKKKIEVN